MRKPKEDAMYLAGYPTFFDRQNVEVEILPYASGIPVGIEQVYHPEVELGGAYGTWGHPVDNGGLVKFVESRLGRSLNENELLDPESLGFTCRHHIEDMTDSDHLALEIDVGARFLRRAAEACGWEPGEVEGVLVGTGGPVAPDFTEQIATAAGIADEALKVSIHKACDSSTSGLHLALNPDLVVNQRQGRNIAKELEGKKVLVAGIEGLSRFVRWSNDTFAMQLFGNGAGVVGLVPGRNLKFLVGKTHAALDEKGTVTVRMYYPHSRVGDNSDVMEEIQQAGVNHIRLAGFMREPVGEEPIGMESPVGMVKLFVRSGVELVSETLSTYRSHIEKSDSSGKQVSTTVVHHANLKIIQLMDKQLQKYGIDLPMPWVLQEFGNVSAASNMIAFLRQLDGLKAGDHVLFCGFGAGTYFDVLVVELNAQAS